MMPVLPRCPVLLRPRPLSQAAARGLKRACLATSAVLCLAGCGIKGDPLPKGGGTPAPAPMTQEKPQERRA